MESFEIPSEWSGWENVIVGIGDSGCHTVEYLQTKNISDVRLVCVGASENLLSRCSIQNQIYIDLKKSCVSKSNKGSCAAYRTDLKNGAATIDHLLFGDALFLIVDVDDCTGSGVMPALVEQARGAGSSFIVAIVMLPFTHERRTNIIEKETRQVSELVDVLLVIDNNKIVTATHNETEKNSSLFAARNIIVEKTLKSMIDFNSYSGLLNYSMKDIKSALRYMGRATVARAYAKGMDRAQIATQRVLDNHLLNNDSAHIAKNIFVNVTAGANFNLSEYAIVGSTIQKHISTDTELTLGPLIDPALEDELRITIIANGRIL